MNSFLFCRLEKKYRRCSKCVPCTWLLSLHRRAIAYRTLANMPGLCLIWSNAVNIRSISSCLVLTGKKSRAVRSGDLAGHPTGPLSLCISSSRLCSDVLVFAGWSALERHHVGITFLCVSQGVSSPWAAEVCSGGIPSKLPHSNGLEWWQVPAVNLQEFYPRCLRRISPGELWLILRVDCRRPRCGCCCCWRSHLLWNRPHQ